MSKFNAGGIKVNLKNRGYDTVNLTREFNINVLESELARVREELESVELYIKRLEHQLAVAKVTQKRVVMKLSYENTPPSDCDSGYSLEIVSLLYRHGAPLADLFWVLHRTNIRSPEPNARQSILELAKQMYYEYKVDDIEVKGFILTTEERDFLSRGRNDDGKE